MDSGRSRRAAPVHVGTGSGGEIVETEAFLSASWVQRCAAARGDPGEAVQVSGPRELSVAAAHPARMRDESCVTSYGNEGASQDRRPQCC